MIVATPAARWTDPDTSHDAAEHVTRTGARGHQQRQAAEAVRNFPGKTSLELAEAAGMCRFMLARRLPECLTAGTVRRGQSRTCSVSGRRACTWWSPDTGAQMTLPLESAA